jgi:hypothetical protein
MISQVAEITGICYHVQLFVVVVEIGGEEGVSLTFCWADLEP